MFSDKMKKAVCFVMAGLMLLGVVSVIFSVIL